MVLDLNDVKRIQEARVTRFWEFLNDAGRIDLNPRIRLGPFDGIANAWKNEPCIVVGSGPSLKDFDFSRLNKIHSIGINHVIEDYDGFEWFLFLDQRFLNRTSYNMRNYKGKVFCQNTCRPYPFMNAVLYKTRKHLNKSIDLDIHKGLYNGMLSGVAALHLALISGANPIYIIGMDCGGGAANDYHYKKTYTGAMPTLKKWEKYKKTARFFEKFRPWKNRIVNLSPISTIKTFQKKDINQIPILKPKKKIQVERIPTICHVISMQNMNVMGDISRQVFNQSYGKHIFANINGQIPHADIYLLECFINGSQKYRNFKKPNPNSKIISLIHSSGSCLPSVYSDKIITITNAWQKVLEKKRVKSVVIPAAIDISLYNHEINYSNKVFGRISRYSPGKVHPHWNQACLNILTKVEDSKCIFFTGNTRRLLVHPRFILDSTIKINEHEKKAKKLAQLNIYADMHNRFVETFSLCLLEAMATGLACVMYSDIAQPAMREVLGNAGIWCENEAQFQKHIIDLLLDSEKNREYGQKAKERAKNYSIDKMIEKYDKLFKEVL
jgi:glycosyltransferase involved in cell wall biosynthesis